MPCAPWKEGVVAKLTGGLGDLCRRRKITFVQGRAVFRDAHTLTIRAASGSEEPLPSNTPFWQRLHAPRPCRACRSIRRASWIPRRRSALPDIPESLLVIGGGYIGLELGSVYAALGTRVTRRGNDSPDCFPASTATSCASSAGACNSGSTPSCWKRPSRRWKNTDCIRVGFEGAAAPESEQDYEKILVAVGRRPADRGPGSGEHPRGPGLAGLRAGGFTAPDSRTHDLCHRRRYRGAHAGAQGGARGPRGSGGRRGRENGVRAAGHTCGGVHRSRDRLVRTHRIRGQGTAARRHHRPLPLGRLGPRADTGATATA